MSLTNLTTKTPYAGNGVTTVFPFTFKVFDPTHLVVTETVTATGVTTTLVLNTDYTVTGVGLDAGGSITRASAPPTGTTGLIRRVMPLTQTADIRNQSAFYAATHEDVFDKAAMVDQYLQDQITDINSEVGAGPVQSFNTRTGVVLPAANDYSFADLSGTATVAQIPNLPASQITSGQLALAQGGTGADLSATGGASQFVSQSTVGGALTVIQPAFTDLSGAATTAQIATALTAPGPIGGTTPSTIQGTTITASTQFSGPGTGLTGTAASLTAGTATVANGLKSATTTVSVSGATAPTSGQVLTATSGTTAVWQTPSAGGAGAFNRIVNGSFYQGLGPWVTSGTTAPVYSSATATSGTSGSAAMIATGGTVHVTTTGSISQAFSIPAPSGAVTLTYKTACYYSAASFNSNTGSVKVYIYNASTGAETLVATHSLTATSTSPSFTNQSVTVTTNITGAGEWGVRFELMADTDNTGGIGTKTTTTLVDDVALVI